MARSTPVKKAWRSLTWLLIITAGFTAILGGGVLFDRENASWAPRLALDLEGGTQIILAAQLADGQTVSGDQLNQAVGIIRQRIDASGVSEAEITTQGTQNIVVSLPGIPDQQTLDRIESSARLEFRPVLVTDVATDAALEDGATSDEDAAVDGDATAEEDTADGEGAEAVPTESAPAETPLESTPTASPTSPSDLAYVTPALQDEFTNFDCSTVDDLALNIAPTDQPLITCDDTGAFKFVLGPVEITGENIADATAGLTVTSQGATTNEWGVNLSFDGAGSQQFAEVTQRLVLLQGAQNQFAVVLDGRVITAPRTNSAITDGNARITGSFTQASAQALADQLKFGALPIGFETQSRDSISPTLGTTQLQSGIIAGIIGLVLVVGYSLFQYRLLGLVTVASLVVTGVITYLIIGILSWRQGFRLSLAGVAGLIVAIGLTADSFIVYFERIRDELRDGRGLVSAVEAGWKRALRTILAAKGVNLLSAVVLFALAIGNVRGFALTLGITTVIDVLIVVLFTHPVLQLLATTKFFANGHPASGLDPNALGAVYRGRAQFRAPVAAGSRPPRSGREAEKRQTIAERKAAEALAASISTSGKAERARTATATIEAPRPAAEDDIDVEPVPNAPTGPATDDGRSGAERPAATPPKAARPSKKSNKRKKR